MTRPHNTKLQLPSKHVRKNSFPVKNKANEQHPQQRDRNAPWRQTHVLRGQRMKPNQLSNAALRKHGDRLVHTAALNSYQPLRQPRHLRESSGGNLERLRCGSGGGRGADERGAGGQAGTLSRNMSKVKWPDGMSDRKLGGDGDTVAHEMKNGDRTTERTVGTVPCTIMKAPRGVAIAA